MEKGKKKSYLKWTPQMDEALLNVLVEYHNKGETHQNGWKSYVYTAAINSVREKCDIIVTKDNLIGRMKTFEKHHSIVSKMLATSGFGWDWESKKVQVDNDDVWTRYIQANPGASSYRDKVIHHWELMSIICSKEHATGEGARTGVDNLEEMAAEDHIHVEESNTCYSTHGQSSAAQSAPDATPYQRVKKRHRSNALIDMLGEMNQTLKIACTPSEAPVTSPSVQEVLATLNEIPDLDEADFLKAYTLLVADDRQFQALKALSIGRKKAFVLLLIKK